MMDYWNNILGNTIFSVHYEELVNDLEGVSKAVIKHCGLDWDSRCLDFYKTKRDVNTPSYHQVRQPIYTKSLGRWKNYEKHIGPLIEALKLE